MSTSLAPRPPLDPITIRAQESLVDRPAHERLLLSAGYSLRELAKQMQVNPAQLHRALTMASSAGRLTERWRHRLTAACGVSDAELVSLFGLPPLKHLLVTGDAADA